MEQETDKAKRDEMIRQATKLYVDDFAYIPLHQQAVVWAARKNIDLVQLADNYVPAALRDGEVAPRTHAHIPLPARGRG
jgi:ABC-type transport system substrate-binding protein